MTFPHLGTFYVGIGALFRMLDVEVIVPPKITKRTLTLGSVHGPESACLPLKINIGNFIEAIEQGADTIFMAGGYGPCRFGYFAQVHREILSDLGYDVDVFVVEQPRTGRKEFFNSIKSYFPEKSWFEVIQAIRFGWKKVLILDQIEAIILKNRAYEVRRGSHSAFWQHAIRLIDQAMTSERLNRVSQELLHELEQIEKDFTKDVLRIATVGEIYLMNEPASNLDVDEKLGNLGVSIVRTEFVSDYVREKVFKTKKNPELFQMAKPYMRNEIGGHGFHTVANTVKFARQGYDGVVQILPFTCIPEIVGMAILDHVSKKEDIPVLTLIFDEHSGEAGMETRLEAFVELIKRKNSNRDQMKVGERR